MTTEELVRSLRICAETADPVDRCEFSECCLQKENLADTEFCDSMCMSRLLNLAADKIEEDAKSKGEISY